MSQSRDSILKRIHLSSLSTSSLQLEMLAGDSLSPVGPSPWHILSSILVKFEGRDHFTFRRVINCVVIFFGILWVNFQAVMLTHMPAIIAHLLLIRIIDIG